MYYQQADLEGKQDYSMAIQIYQRLMKEYPSFQYSQNVKQMLTLMEEVHKKSQ
jgi:hypothetical protein